MSGCGRRCKSLGSGRKRKASPVLTFRSLASEKDNIGITVEIPAIEVIAGHERMTADEINEEISSLCKQYEEEAVLRAEEYKNAFLETGGTPEEWAEHELEITVWYEIKQQSRDYLSFVVKGAQSWTNGNGDSRYYNLDLRTGTIVTLRDMLGDHYIERANESIREQIYERQQAGEAFFAAGEGSFSGISEDAKFYINENNRPVIVFEKYEIAPGASGEIEFEIGED